ncbi:SID1 transmembrane family member 1-like [Clytia hemisphaerica]
MSLFFWLWLTATICYAETFSQNGTKPVQNAILDKVYDGHVKDGVEDIYFFNLTETRLKQNGTVRIRVCSPDASPDTPIFFVARLLRGVISWSLPYNAGEKSYNYFTQTICRSIDGNDLHQVESFYLDVSTLNPIGFSYRMIAKSDLDYQLSTGKVHTASTTPAELLFFTYSFLPDDERVLVTATSASKTCAVLIVQNVKQCASLTQSTAANTGMHATMTKQAGIVVERGHLEKIFIVFMVKATDTDCTTRKNSINPFSQANDGDHLNPLKFIPKRTKADCSLYGDGSRNKTIEIEVISLPKVKDYVEPVLMPLAVYGSFYIVALFVMAAYWCTSETGGKSFYTYLFPKKVKKEGEEDEEDGAGGGRSDEELLESDRLLPPGGSNSVNSYNAVPQSPNAVNDNEDFDEEDLRSPLADKNEYDFLDDRHHDKDVYRLNLKLTVVDTSRKSYKKLEKKFNIYYWNLMTVGIFYALPVVQLVLTYQRVTNESGDQDICYYNFFCARPYHILSAFNNVYSNIGYMLLGLLFVFFVMRRDRIAYMHHVKNPDKYQKYGLPKHYGIFYAMGWALFMEGVMSGCYHVCPNYSNFQFDTAFMYILGILCSLRLYQARHHDIFINGHFAFAGFAFVIFTSVIGVVYRSEGFFITFCFFHIMACFYLSLQIYYMGRAKTALVLMWHSRGYKICSRPQYPVRFMLLVVFMGINIALSLYGVTNEVKDFATFLLGIIICNGLLYVGFYCIMKLYCGEKIKLFPVIFALASMVTWGIAIKFFVAGLTDWQTTAAQSREGNRKCIIGNFYDDHDLWHFLSACALFFSFMCVLTIDDDLDKTERSKIKVF